MSNQREELVTALVNICLTLAENSEGRVVISYAEKDECQDPEMEAAHFLKLDGQRIGRDIELLGFMAETAGVEIALSDFAQTIVMIKAKGVLAGYDAVRQDCSDLERFMSDEKIKAQWREIFSIPAKSEKSAVTE